ncbi:hypothetical protein EHW99_2503 [Erwinia amylovora]|uniref:Uncharacterized protein n=3 Tax=Erwinia amylovora TaxID=552 RepID=A0A831A243_ERWAM|nr:hypothetical protein EaACW_1085 [Erwinia amylovora ACW56400]QJQ55205.1 hypothetical protein EHX00_2503 [Erwinia amylovora]CBA20027.1 hypothetical protein predicted by Glimmer/Critica [Erwinia amylovora CFBP1430]CBX79926.1 hypothetical protein predicted by Glimmer/Critica [Erwinia amylovora ATCC BAA-2158]CCO77930.1 hypothetical protein BN432_1110 [Erwinia amylovora Ea356]CCO81717.1 hypothetical protein BN433_1124 [Erwinia amylovora Ea266]CCO85521.1 hypothetical protein BN434_1111 [Erwinia a
MHFGHVQVNGIAGINDLCQIFSCANGLRMRNG